MYGYIIGTVTEIEASYIILENNKIETVKAGSRIYVEIDEETNEIIWRNMFKTVSRRNLYKVTEKQN